VLGKQGSDLAWGGVEELPPWIDQVDPDSGERLVQASLQANRVVAEHQRMHVVAERHRGIPELIDSVTRVEAAGQADLDHALPEGAAVADDIHIAGADIRRSRLHPLQGPLDLGHLGLELLSASRVPALADRGQGVAVVGELLGQPLLLLLVLSAGLGLFPELLSFGPLSFLFLSQLGAA
jgi:hypothetical protein